MVDVRLIRHMGCDADVLEIARMTRDAQGAGHESDVRLMHRMVRDGHDSVLEHVVFTFLVECPIYTARQWMRHRWASYTERSLRHCQGSEQHFPDLGQTCDWARAYSTCAETYHHLQATGVPRQTARAVLPMATMTRFYWTANLRCVLNFLDQRLHPSAQEEIRGAAEAVEELVMPVVPLAMTAWLATSRRRAALESSLDRLIEAVDSHREATGEDAEPHDELLYAALCSP